MILVMQQGAAKQGLDEAGPGLQSLQPEKFQELMREILPFVRAAGREI